ncbi:uncharacterized protein EV420DRAFT_614827 [Desarmillaria tabescens]|uniref:Uncharacterized protein n=1 Tax=Armillaria tabescens TaxID=1929756 RepID=A0AA39K3T7_ARMTA|nr:uncharacterized protein EV420DRAFT_614827 [Desarmillaria tabescens]KAK0454000.1 hypothetical protein EV420DRAFT_614827 [Desarmillaria tabescens]
MLISGIVFKIMNTHQGYTSGNDYVLGFVLYSSFVLVTTIWCTAFIIYRILTVGQASGEVGGGVSFYRHVIEVLIESSALYSVSLILLVVFEVREVQARYYVDVMTGIARGVAPTLLVGRVAAGHARSDDSWQGSVMSSLHFGTTHSRNNDQPSLEEETLQSIVLEEDLHINSC